MLQFTRMPIGSSLLVLLATFSLAGTAAAVPLLTSGVQDVTIMTPDVYDAVIATDMSNVDMLSGTVSGQFLVEDNATALIAGGSLTGPLEVNNSGFVTIDAQDNTLISLDGNPQPYGTILNIANCGADCTISGTLDDGTVFSFSADIDELGQIQFVPEPSTSLMLGLGLIGLAAGSPRRRAVR